MVSEGIIADSDLLVMSVSSSTKTSCLPLQSVQEAKESVKQEFRQAFEQGNVQYRELEQSYQGLQVRENTQNDYLCRHGLNQEGSYMCQ